MVETRPWPIPAGTLAVDGSVTIQHVSDTHFGYRSWSHQEGDHQRRDIEQGLIPPITAFVHTGDIVDGPNLPTEDAYAKSWMTAAAKGVPSVWCMGNHDLRDRSPNTRAAWESVYGRSANSFVDVAGWRIVTWAVDSHVTNTDWIIPAATWTWLDSVIGAAPGPVLLADHYPLWELGVAQVNAVQPASRMAELISDYPHIAGMIAGHMHWEIGDARAAKFVPVGNRSLFPIITDVSSMLSISPLTRDQSAQLPSISTYVTMWPDRWEVRYRLHGRHGWGGPAGMRVTTLHLDTGLVEHTMGA